jgi:hypothetical protein
MTEDMEKLTKGLWRMAERGKVKAFSTIIRRYVQIPPPLHTVEIALDDVLPTIGAIRDRRERAKILEELFRSISQIARNWQHYTYTENDFRRRWEQWHYLAHRWYDVWHESLALANQSEQDESRFEAILSLTKAFEIWDALPLHSFVERFDGPLRRYITRFIRQTERMDTGYWKAMALAILARHIAEGSLGIDDRLLEEAEMAWEGEDTSDQAKVERLRTIVVVSPGAGGRSLELGPPRYADFAFHYDERGKLGQKVSIGHTLQAQQWYRLEVAVRVKPIGIPATETARLSIWNDPRQRDDVTIMVAAEGDGFEIEEPIRTLMLPPWGDSRKNAIFRVRPLRKSANHNDMAQIRVRLYYEFNLLEEAVLSAEIVGKFDSPTQSQLGVEIPISFRQERLERRYIDFDNVEPRIMHIDVTKHGDQFLFNFAFYNAVDKKMVFTAPARLPPTDLEDELITIRKIWYDIAMSKTFTEQLEGDKDEFLVNVRRLANAGRRLWVKLFKQERGSSLYEIGDWLEKHPPERDSIIQVSFHPNAVNFIFPWALIYDRPIPDKEYELPDPEGFWGMRYCIEQQLPNMIKGTDEPIDIDELKLGFMLWEQFRNAQEEKLMMERLIEQSAGKLRVTIPPITDASVCYKLLSDCDAHVLYFYTHGYTRHRQADIGVAPNFELFIRRYERLDADSSLRKIYRTLYESIKQNQFEPDRSWIELTYGKLYLDELYDHIEHLSSNPLVILNMCESAQVTPSLSDSFVHFFLDRGATAVIGTECPMTIQFAHPFAEMLLTNILRGGDPLGIVMLYTRRHFMELKNPLGLAYSLFGSATTAWYYFR